ncbi:preprotein translocase subunit SecA [Buchnera aphidicola (Ceratovacuna keduensis)]|uniref:preprotein translocase subunit SecA n=1 Tax=Buchnera aphidicola TaxID=9 RepID=UPI0031B89090
MLIKFFKNLFKNNNEKILEEVNIILNLINDMEKKFSKFSDKKLRENTNKYRNKIFNKNTLNSILPEAYSTVREASKRVLGMRHFDVQIIGGIVLNNRCIAEMKTGEGKTLTSTLPIYLNSLSGNGVHVVTMNDYLANRDYNQNKKLFEFLGVSSSLNLQGMSIKMKKNAYSSDITYGTNNEFCFDYLRDNMIFCNSNRVQKKLNYAIIDEVDSILIDEARTPLVISGFSYSNKNLYNKINNLVYNFILKKEKYNKNDCKNDNFYIDKKRKQIYLTENGFLNIENIFVKNNVLNKNSSLYCSENIMFFQYIINSLKAHKLFFKNIDYIVKDNKILIVDEHTGRISNNRRWSDGLHQAIEAKEKIKINDESYTLASITFQNYFRLYKKLSGMSGTAETESEEFKSIYNLNTVVIPTNKPICRKDFNDLIYMTEKEKIKSIIKDIKNCIKNKQPVLVGTSSIEKSELISNKLNKLKIKHNILNAKFHSKEAEIIKNAGMLSSVTIATNMAGRGTDIMLGGSFNYFLKKNKKKYKFFSKKKIFSIWENNKNVVLSLGGLHIIGAERHESRRIDNQLIGRSGRQGDVGSSRFYVSMEDSLIKIFVSNKIINIIKKLGIKNNEPINNIFINKAIYNSQKKLENYNYEIRAKLLEYDDIVNEQRLIFYYKRNKILKSKNITKIIFKISIEVFNSLVNFYFKEKNKNFCENIKILKRYLKKVFNILFLKKNIFIEKNMFYNNIIIKNIFKIFKKNYLKKKINFSEKEFNKFEKIIVLKVLDKFWREHLYDLEHLRSSIHLRGYADKDPKQEYKKESFLMFMKMISSIKNEIISMMSFFSSKKYSFDFFILKMNDFYNKKLFLETSFQEFIKNKNFY